MKRFVLAVALACALSGTALAGAVPSTDVSSPTPPENAQTTLSGDVPSTDYAPPPAENSLLAVLLTIIGAI
jgi:hypothetical protein